MDTHITSEAALDPGAGLTARLPGEPDPEAFTTANPSDKPEPPVRTSAPPRAWRRHSAGLLAGVAIGTVVFAGGAFVLSPYNHMVPLPERVTATVHQLAAEAGLGPDQPLSPSASLAGIHLPAKPDLVVTPRYKPNKPREDLKEILAMHAESHLPDSPTPPSLPVPPRPLAAAEPQPAATPPATVAQTESSPSFVPHEPGSSIAASVGGNAEPANPPVPAAPVQLPPGTADITQAVVAAATVHARPAAAPQAGSTTSQAAPQVPASTAATTPPVANATHAASPAEPSAAPTVPPTSVSAPHAAAKLVEAAAHAAPADAAERALHLQAGPMTDAQQVKVLELVTQVATMVHDLKQQDASLRVDFAKAQEDESAHLKDLERRIALAEARKAVGAAENAPFQAASTPPPAPAATPAARPVAVTPASAALPVDVPAAAKRYRVQAASPGMAMLTEVARGGGGGAQLQVTVGDTIPGWGKVKSVAQRGTSWVVSTEHGVIE